MISKSTLLMLLLLVSSLLSTTASSSFVITEHQARNVKCFQSYNDQSGLVERSICWHDREFYADRWHDWPCEIDCDKNVAVRIYLEDYTVRYQQRRLQEKVEREMEMGMLTKFQLWGRRMTGWWTTGMGGDKRSIFKIYIQRMDSEWQLVTYLRKGTGDCKNEHDEEGWTIWACAEIKTI
ncbi:hypothetical protein BG003_000168 [Podila horticola]|nr:hypothetical protein BG003_000168 [Podila horticola]